MRQRRKALMIQETVMGFFRRYRETLRHEHGWEVELTCPQCGHTGLPRYEGWKPNLAGGFGKTPTIFANLACTKCGRDLRRAAGEQLVATFSRIAVPKGNKRLLVWFVIAVLLIVSLPIVAQFTLRPGFHVASFGVILVLPLIIAVNYRIASMRKRCPCGVPEYVFMGMLGRTYCYRCSTCGRLLRLRD
jgi:hypothetical protein